MCKKKKKKWAALEKISFYLCEAKHETIVCDTVREIKISDMTFRDFLVK